MRYLVNMKRRTQLFFHRRHRFRRDSAGHNQVEVAEIRIHIQSKSMRSDRARNVDANGGDFCGALGVSPSARQSRYAPSRNTEIAARAKQHLFQPPNVVDRVDHRVTDQVSTRRLRIVKYRGTAHGTNEYPFLIDEDGFSVLPVTSLGLQHEVSEERISSGVPRLDTMLGGEGFYRGSTVLASGTAGTGKTSLASHL